MRNAFERSVQVVRGLAVGLLVASLACEEAPAWNDEEDGGAFVGGACLDECEVGESVCGRDVDSDVIYSERHYLRCEDPDGDGCFESQLLACSEGTFCSEGECRRARVGEPCDEADCDDDGICVRAASDWRCLARCEEPLCADGSICTPVREGGAVCHPGGSIAAGEPCETNLDCVRSTICVGGGEQAYLCRPACLYGADDDRQCPAGECMQLAEGPLGYCEVPDACEAAAQAVCAAACACGASCAFGGSEGGTFSFENRDACDAFFSALFCAPGVDFEPCRAAAAEGECVDGALVVPAKSCD